MRIAARHRPSDAPIAPARGQLAAAAAALLLALAAAACGRSPETRAADSVASIRSWTATARLAAESWLQAKTPSAYTRSTLEKAEATLSQETRTLEQGPVPRSIAGEMALLRAPAAVARRMAGAVERGDRGAVRGELARLRGLDARLAALDERLAAEARAP